MSSSPDKGTSPEIDNVYQIIKSIFFKKVLIMISIQNYLAYSEERPHLDHSFECPIYALNERSLGNLNFTLNILV